MKRIQLLVALAALVMVTAGCPKGGNTGGNGGGGGGNVIKIVSSLPRTGSAKGQTTDIVNGIKMALEEANHQAGGFKLEYSDLDDATVAAGQWAAEAEQKNAQESVADQDVMVFIGPFNSGAAKISMPILNEANLLMISPANTYVGLTMEGETGEPEKYRPSGKLNYTRVVPTDDVQGFVAADWAKDMGAMKVFILDDGELYGRGIAKMFKERCDELGLDVVGEQTIDPKATEFRSLMTTISSKSPDLVYFGGTTQSKGGQIAKELVSANIDAKLIVPDGCYEKAFITAAGAENCEGKVFFTFGGVPPKEQTGSGKDFIDKFEKKYGYMPDAYSIYGYEAAKVALRAINDAKKKDRRAITDAALAIRDFDGALGKWSFDENGDTSMKRMSGSTVKDGEFVLVKILGE